MLRHQVKDGVYIPINYGGEYVARVQEVAILVKEVGPRRVSDRLSGYIRYRDHGMGVIGKKLRWQLTFPMLMERLLDSNLRVSHD